MRAGLVIVCIFFSCVSAFLVPKWMPVRSPLKSVTYVIEKREEESPEDFVDEALRKFAGLEWEQEAVKRQKVFQPVYERRKFRLQLAQASLRIIRQKKVLSHVVIRNYEEANYATKVWDI